MTIPVDTYRKDGAKFHSDEIAAGRFHREAVYVVG
jgi:hypothetical protein